MTMQRRGLLVWLAVVVPIWIVLTLSTAWEPVFGDGWGHVDFHHSYPLSLGHIWFFAKYNYLEMNPRLGQIVTMLLYTPGPWHAIVTPMFELALVHLITTLALARWPSIRRTEDALAFATVFALLAACVPRFGHMLFYRPYVGNYLFGLTACCAFLVPYRLDVEAPRGARLWSIPLMFVLGLAAGLSNEHTTPTIVVMAITAIVYSARRDSRVRAWMIAGVLGAVAGGVALYFAPGQALRYNGLATQTTLLGRVVDRGALGNLKPFADVAIHLLPALAWLVIVWPTRNAPMEASRTRALATRAYAGMAVLVLVTLLVSPKLGQRLELAPIAFACTAVTSWLLPRVVRPWQRLLAWCGAAGMILAFVVACVHSYAVAGPEFAVRLATIEHAPKGASITVAPYSIRRSHWFYGDDFLIPEKRAGVAAQYGLAAIALDAQRVATPAPDEP
jgi:hypothetical protein